MNTALSFLISAGIIAFGLWILACSIKAGSSVGFTLMGFLSVAIGSISFSGASYEAELASAIDLSHRMTPHAGDD